MVVDETFAEQFVEQGYEYEGVGRIVGVDGIKAFAEESHDRKRETGSHRVGVFPKVSEKTIHGSKCGVAVDTNAIDDFARRLSLGRGTDHRHPVTCGTERIGFPADSDILRKRQVLQKH